MKNSIVRSTVVFVMAAFVIVGFGGASIVGPLPLDLTTRQFIADPAGTNTLNELAHLGLLKNLQEKAIEELLTYQNTSGKSLAEVLHDRKWLQKLGIVGSTYKATWYAANPFDLLPVDLQISIRKTQTPFYNRAHIKKWLKAVHAPDRWKTALDLALIETTPINLWRASRGERPYAKNGQYLQPIVVEKATGAFEVRDGHIATDPRIIPTNTKLLLVVRINGQERIIKVKATDIGEAIKGRHVDLPIAIKPRYTRNHSIVFPGEYIRNPEVLILFPGKVSRGQKA